MPHRPADSHLSTFVDQLWRRPADRADLAEYLVARLGRFDRLVLAAWDVAATFGPPSGRLTVLPPGGMEVADNLGRLFLEAMVVGSHEAPSEHQPLITYRDWDMSVLVAPSSPNIPNRSVFHDPRGLLLAIQLIRDHLDSVLLQPRELRDRSIAQFAASSQLDQDQFRRLASWFPAVEVYARP